MYGDKSVIFTERELSSEVLSHERLLSLLGLSIVHISALHMSSNSYGEFLFMTLVVERPSLDKPEVYTVYGLGFHDHSERWQTDWAFFTSSLYGKALDQADDMPQVLRELTLRKAQVELYKYEDEKRRTQRSQRAKLFDLLASADGDEDAALIEIEDYFDEI